MPLYGLLRSLQLLPYLQYFRWCSCPDYFDAENCFNTAVNLHPANFKAVYNRGKLRLKTENTEGAIADLDKATSLKPEHAGAHELFGDALLKAGKEVEAALQWRIAEELKKKKKQ